MFDFLDSSRLVVDFYWEKSDSGHAFLSLDGFHLLLEIFFQVIKLTLLPMGNKIRGKVGIDLNGYVMRTYSLHSIVLPTSQEQSVETAQQHHCWSRRSCFLFYSYHQFLPPVAWLQPLIFVPTLGDGISVMAQSDFVTSSLSPTSLQASAWNLRSCALS